MNMQEIIDRNAGRFISVRFVKKSTGEVRQMTFRTNVKKGIKGTGLSFNPQEKQLKPVYDVKEAQKTHDPSQSWRMVPLDNGRIIEVKAGGKRYVNNGNDDLIEEV